MSEKNGAPKGWSQVTIDELCDLNPKHDRSIPDETVVSFVPMAAVSETLGAIMAPEPRPLGEVRRGFTHFADGDVIFAKITPCMENGKAASVRGMQNGLACGTTEFFVLRSRGGVDQDFLYNFLRQQSYRRIARAQMQSGVGQARVPKEFVLGTELPIPPLPEQRRIVAKIETLQARSRRVREALESVPRMLETFRQSVLAAAFRGDLTADWREAHPDVEPASELLERIRVERRQKWEEAALAKYEAKGQKPPKGWKEKYKEPEPVSNSNLATLSALPNGWCWIPFAEFCTIQGGFAFKSRDYINDGTPLIRIGDLDEGAVTINESTARLPSYFVEEYTQFRLKRGDVLIAMSGATTGKMAVFECDEVALLNQRVGRFLPHAPNLIHAPYVRGLVESIVEDIRSRAYGGAQPNISPTEIASTLVALPPLEEQFQVAQLLSEVRSTASSIEIRCYESEAALSQLDQSILAKAFRGELVPQDPNDEPATMLLERIREQREAAEAKGKQKTKRKSRKKT